MKIQPVIIEYGAGNLRSVVNAVRALGYEPLVSDRTGVIKEAAALILPGVGAAGCVMNGLREHKLVDTIQAYITDGKPFLGVCLGLQVLFDMTDEGYYQCLGLIPGRVKRFVPGLKIPHMGWNQVRQKQAHPVFDGIPDNANFYFVHSYYAEPLDKQVIAGETYYGLIFCSAIARGKLVATQFHPEKSGVNGLKIYDNFFRMAAC
jgi:imidazole glycerol-phosphate synthase subunit HisH